MILHNPNMEELWKLISKIPEGMVTSYGELGRLLSNPASGYEVGRWMARCPENLAWWRVVGKHGNLPVHKRDPRIGNDQRTRLEAEGVTFNGDLVVMQRHAWFPTF